MDDLLKAIGAEESPASDTTRFALNEKTQAVSTALANLNGGEFSKRAGLVAAVAEAEKVVAAFWWELGDDGKPKKDTDDPNKLVTGGTFGKAFKDLTDAWGSVQTKEGELRVERQKCKDAQYTLFRQSLAQAEAGLTGTL